MSEFFHLFPHISYLISKAQVKLRLYLIFWVEYSNITTINNVIYRVE
jgi:hypothetical protein